MGSNTSYLFKVIKTVKGDKKRLEKVEDEFENIQSNGSLMRSVPLFCSDEDVKTNVYSTNPNEVNHECIFFDY